LHIEKQKHISQISSTLSFHPRVFVFVMQHPS
jgi:hypothetical protein